MLVTRSLVMALLLVACTKKDEPPGPDAAPAAGQAEAGQAARAKAPDVQVQGQTELRVKVGTTLARTVSQSRGVAPEHRFEWSAQPKVDGGALRFLEVRVEPPPQDVDGGSTKHHYRFVAVAPGRAAVTIERKNPGAEAPREPDRFTVVVTQ